VERASSNSDSYQAWPDRYQANLGIIGRTQMLAGVKRTIIGVSQEGFYGTFAGYGIQLSRPASMEEVFEPGGYKMENRGPRWIEGFSEAEAGC